MCSWCGTVGHVEKTCFDKENGIARGRKSDSVTNGGQVNFGQGSREQRHAEILMGEINFGEGDGDGDEKEWVCDSGADYHMTGDVSMFEKIEQIPFDLSINQIRGKIPVARWGVVRLSTDKANGRKGELELHEVLFMPGMRVNIFSLRRMRKKGACSYTFEGEPQPGKVIPIFNREGEQIATMKETLKARPTLICEEFSMKGKMGVIGANWGKEIVAKVQLGLKELVRGIQTDENEPVCEEWEEMDVFNPWPAVYICGDAGSRPPVLKCDMDKEPRANVLEGVGGAAQNRELLQEEDEHKVKSVVLLATGENQPADEDVFWDSPVEEEEEEKEEMEMEEKEDEEEGEEEEEEEEEEDEPIEDENEDRSENEDEGMDGYEDEDEEENKSTITGDGD